MKQNCFSIKDTRAYSRADEDALIAMEPAAGCDTPYIKRSIVDIVGFGILENPKAFIHLSGPTGSAKSLMINAVLRNDSNLRCLAESLSLPYKPVEFSIADMTEFDGPSEVRSRRALREKNGGTETFDEDSVIIRALKRAAQNPDESNHVIWLQEISRIVNPHIQSSILNLMTKNELVLKDGSIVPTGTVCWICDSNLSASETGNYVLNKYDEAFQRRLDSQVELSYLGVDQEIEVMEYLVRNSKPGKEADTTLIEQLVKLGHSVKTLKGKGQLLSIASPTIYGYKSAYDHIKGLPGLSTSTILMNNFLGNSNNEDKKQIESLINKVFFRFNFSKKNTFQPQTF